MYYHVTLCPEWKNDTVSAVGITVQTDRSVRKDEDAFLRIVEFVKIPFCPVEGKPKMRDALGIVPYAAMETDPGLSFSAWEALKPLRDTQGELTLSYRIVPRVQPMNYRSSPYLDCVSEKGGMNGCGETMLYSLPDPSGTKLKYDFILDWDLKYLPEGSAGLYAYSTQTHYEAHGVDNRHVIDAVYACGLIKGYESDGVGFYWFDEVPFDGEAYGKLIVDMFHIMQKKFHDSGEPYRVMTRHNSFPGQGGGTAFARSYIYSYCDGQEISEADLKDLMAHEMVHNWPTMKDEPAGLGTWYVEGCAEYFSTMVLLEHHLASLKDVAAAINEKAGSYYSNPTMVMDNMELGRIYWSDLRAQRLPYHRGMLYLSNTDAWIKRETNGKHCLLEIVNALQKIAEPVPEDFLKAGKEMTGLDLRPGYEAMCAGGWIEPDPEAFDGKFALKKVMVKQNNAQHRWEVDESNVMVPGFVWEPKEEES